MFSIVAVSKSNDNIPPISSQRDVVSGVNRDSMGRESSKEVQLWSLDKAKPLKAYTVAESITRVRGGSSHNFPIFTCSGT